MALRDRVGHILGISVSGTNPRARWWPAGLLALLMLVAIYRIAFQIPSPVLAETRAEQAEAGAADQTTPAAKEDDKPAWADAVAEALPRWEIIQCDQQPSVSVGEHRGYRLLLRMSWKEEINPSQQSRDERELKEGEYVVKYSHVDLVLFPATDDLPDDMTKKVPWKEAEQQHFVKPIDLGTGLGMRWFARTTLYLQDDLRQKLALQGGDDPIGLLVEGLFVQDRGTCTANSMPSRLARFGDRAVERIEKAIGDRGNEEPWKAVPALARIPTERSTDLLKSLYASQDIHFSLPAAYALIHKPYRESARKEYVDMLRQRLYVGHAAAACVGFGWTEATAILKEICNKPASWGDFRAAFEASRQFEGQPVPEKLREAEKEIVELCMSSERDSPPDPEAIQRTKQTILTSADREAAAVTAVYLARYSTKASGWQVERVRQIGRELVQGLPADTTRKLLMSLFRGFGGEASGRDRRTIRELLDPVESIADLKEEEVKNKNVAWGEVVNGLQAGLATSFDFERPYQLGQDVPLEFLLRNTTDKPITLTHARVPRFVNFAGDYHRPPGPQLFGPDGKQVFPASGVNGCGLPGTVTRTIAPGEVVTLTASRLPLRSEDWEGTTVNLLTFVVKPGKHRVSLSHQFDDQGGKHWGGTVTTGMLDLHVHPNEKPLSIPGNAWGKYRDGVRCRLHTDKARLRLVEPPILLVDLQNHHTQRTIEQVWFTLEFKLEVDGKWTGKVSSIRVGVGPAARLTPGQEWINVPLVLQDSHYYIGPTSSTPGGRPFSQLFGPGRHTIRVDIDGVISNAVEVDILPPKEEAKEEPAWGKPVEGVHVRLRADEKTWKTGTLPSFKADVRNQGKRELSVLAAQHAFEVEVDGRWYFRYAPGYDVPNRKVRPGARCEDIVISLGREWLDKEVNNSKRSPEGVKRLVLPPGRHVVRVAPVLAGSDVRAVSNPVEIEIIAAENTDTPQPDTEGKKDSAKRTAAPSKTTVRGKVVDDATGKPVAHFFTQGGKFDPADPAKVVWGYSETRSGRKNGKFSATVRWSEGWTARIIAAGYLPQPVLTQPPSPGQDVIEVVIRLKRGDAIRGRVLDHTGQGVAKAGVYLAGRGVIGLAEGPRNELQQATVHTDAEGRFEISGRGKDSKAIFVTAPSLFVWRADLPEPGQEAIIRRPQPAKLHIRYDIEGGPPEAQVRIELRTWDMPKWKALVDVVRWVHVKAGEDGLVVDNLPPGVYDISRIKHARAGNTGKDMMLDRQLKLTLASDKTIAYNFVRKTGTPISGDVVGLPKEGVNGVFVYVRDQRVSGDPRKLDEWKLRTFDGLALEGNGPFKTERIPPGKYKVVVEAYKQETREEMSHTGIRLPKWIGTAGVNVPESGEPPKVRLMMRPFSLRQNNRS